MTSLFAQTWLILRTDLRLLWRDLQNHRLREFMTVSLVVVLFIFANLVTISLFVAFRKTPPLGGEMVAWLLFGFMMLGAAMNRAIVVLFERADFDLLLASPVSPRAILLARLGTMFVAAALSVAFFLLPLLNGAILALSWRYAAGYVVWLLLAGACASVGVWLTLILVRWIGPRRARTWSQVVAAVLGACVYIGFQAFPRVADVVGGDSIAHVIRLLGEPPVSTIAQAGRGEWVSLLALTALTLVFVALSTRLLARAFVAGIQAAGGIAPLRRRSGPRYVFANGVARATFWKDLRLIWRDPLLLAQVLPQALYLAPIFLAFSRFGVFPILAPLALAVGTMFSITFAAICTAGEECWDLIRLSPTAELRLRVAKLAAGMAVPIAACLAICVTMAVLGRPGLALLTLLCSVACAAGCSWLQIARIKPTPRRDLLRPNRSSAGSRPGANIGRSFIAFIIMLIGGAGLGFAANNLWIVATVLVGVMLLAVIGCFTLVRMEEVDAGDFPQATVAGGNP